MLSISDTLGSYSDCPTSRENRGSISPPQNVGQKLIAQASTIPLCLLFKHYGVKLDQFTRKACCPFSNHKNGNERTPSFVYYPETNSFRCYGCGIGHKGAHAAEFMAAMEGISREEGAKLALKLFYSSDQIIPAPVQEDYQKRFLLLLSFSEKVKEFKENHPNSKARKFCEDMCQIFDEMNAKRQLGNEALQQLIDGLLFKLEGYRSTTLP
jgi:hypothetical protein